MKKITSLLIALIALIAILSVSAVAQTKGSTKTKTGSIKANPHRFYTIAERDSVNDDLQAKLDSVGYMPTMADMKAMNMLMHDVTLGHGHDEYWSMDGMFKDQMSTRTKAKFDTVTTATKLAAEKAGMATQKVNEVAADLNKLGGDVNDISYLVHGQDEEIEQLELFVSDDETLVSDSKETKGTVTRDETTMKEARAIAEEFIKAKILARRAEKAAAAKMQKFQK